MEHLYFYKSLYNCDHAILCDNSNNKYVLINVNNNYFEVYEYKKDKKYNTFFTYIDIIILLKKCHYGYIDNVPFDLINNTIDF